MTDFIEQIGSTVMDKAVMCVAQTQHDYSGNVVDINQTNELCYSSGCIEDNKNTEEVQKWNHYCDDDDDNYDGSYVPKHQKRIYCDNCKTNFNTDAELDAHDTYLCWQNTKSYNCNYCGEHFNAMADFIRHDEELCIKTQLLELKETGYDEYHTDNYVYNPIEYEEDDEEDDEDYIKEKKEQKIMERRRHKWSEKD